MRYTLTVCKQSGKTIYRNANLNKEQSDNLLGLNTIKLNKINMNKERENKRRLELSSLVAGGEKTYKEALLLVGSFALIIAVTIITVLIK